MSGTLALIGGDEWTDGCDFDAALLEAAGTDAVAILATAAAFTRPDKCIAAAAGYFEPMGVRVDEVPIYERRDALDPGRVAELERAKFVYVVGGSPMHLVAVLKRSPAWDALVALHAQGGVIAASWAGAEVLCDPMVDPRGGAFTVGLGLLRDMAVVPHADTWSHDKLHRTLALAPAGVSVAALARKGALLNDASGWRVAGAGAVTVYRAGAESAVADLPTVTN